MRGKSPLSFDLRGPGVDITSIEAREAEYRESRLRVLNTRDTILAALENYAENVLWVGPAFFDIAPEGESSITLRSVVDGRRDLYGGLYTITVTDTYPVLEETPTSSERARRVLMTLAAYIGSHCAGIATDYREGLELNSYALYREGGELRLSAREE